jgi:hypothetical protein
VRWGDIGRLVAAAALLLPAAARGQDVTGLPNADIRPGYASLSGRFLFAPSGDGDDPTFASQYSYQRNFGERWSLGAAAVFSNRGPGPYQYRALQPSVQHQFAESEEWGGDGSLLLVGRIPDGGDGPGRVALILAGKWIFREDYEVRALAAASRDFGSGARAGVGLGARVEATRRIGTLGRVGGQIADSFNTTARFGDFKEQSHQAGPLFKTLLLGKLNVSAAALFGVSAAAPDAEFRLFLTYDL